MQIRGRKNLKKMAASLSALGAGALVATGTAEAGILYYSPQLNIDIGFAGGLSTILNAPTAISPNFLFVATGTHSTSAYRQRNAVGIFAVACGCFSSAFATSFGLLKLFPASAKWTQSAFSSWYYGGIGRRNWRSSTGGSPSYNRVTAHSVYGHKPFTDKYALFQFFDGPDTYYGWIQLSFSVTDEFGDDPSLGPDLIIKQWGFGEANYVTAAGETPEPATLGSTGLAALALGAVGLRKWRKNRKAA
jgi:hypothetical protein